MSQAAVAHSVPFAVRPLGPTFGAEILGLDLAQKLAPDVVAALQAEFGRRLVLLFRGQELSPEAHIAFSRNFGPLEVHVLNQYHSAEYPELYVISNVGPDGKPRGVHPDVGTKRWHTDTSFMARPSYATILYGVEVAREGGDTEFADMLSGYEALPEATRRRLAGLKAVHDLGVSRARVGDTPLTEDQRRKAPPVVHPLVRTHPPSGRKGVYLGLHCAHIVGLPEAESAALIAEAQDFATQARFVYRHRWRPGDLIMWDNRATLHRATDYDTGRERRVVRRTVLTGEVPV